MSNHISNFNMNQKSFFDDINNNNGNVSDGSKAALTSNQLPSVTGLQPGIGQRVSIPTLQPAGNVPVLRNPQGWPALAFPPDYAYNQLGFQPQRATSFADMVFSLNDKEFIMSALDLLVGRLSRIDSNKYAWGLSKDFDDQTSDRQTMSKSDTNQVRTKSVPKQSYKPTVVYKNVRVQSSLQQNSVTSAGHLFLRESVVDNDDFVIVTQPPVRGQKSPIENVFQSKTTGLFYTARGERIRTSADGFLLVVKGRQGNVSWSLFPKKTSNLRGKPQLTKVKVDLPSTPKINLTQDEFKEEKEVSIPTQVKKLRDSKTDDGTSEDIVALKKYRETKGYVTLKVSEYKKQHQDWAPQAFAGTNQVTVDKDGKIVEDDVELKQLIANVRQSRFNNKKK
jgi:hypothetical protein